MEVLLAIVCVPQVNSMSTLAAASLSYLLQAESMVVEY
jgi:hypothetical protein